MNEMFNDYRIRSMQQYSLINERRNLIQILLTNRIKHNGTIVGPLSFNYNNNFNDKQNIDRNYFDQSKIDDNLMDIDYNVEPFSANIEKISHNHLNDSTATLPLWMHPDVLIAFTLMIFYAMFVLFILIIVVRIIVSIWTTKTLLKSSTSSNVCTFSDGESSSFKNPSQAMNTTTLNVNPNRTNRQHRTLHETTSFAMDDQTNSPSLLDYTTSASAND